MKTALVFALLIATASGINIECEFRIATILGGTFDWFYTCWVKKITFTGSSSLEAVSGTHKTGKNNGDVEQLVFGWDDFCGNMDFIPQNIHTVFPNIIGLDFAYGCNISTLTGDELKDYSNLEWFAFCNNPLERVPGNLFRNNPKIKLVNFNNNNITQVGQDLLKNLPDLTSALFWENNCINDAVTNNRTGVLEIIQDLKEKCPDPMNPTTTTRT